MRVLIAAALVLAGCQPLPTTPAPRTILHLHKDAAPDEPPGQITLIWLRRGAGVAQLIRLAGTPPRPQRVNGDFDVTPFGAISLRLVGPGLSLDCTGLLNPDASGSGSCLSPEEGGFTFDG